MFAWNKEEEQAQLPFRVTGTHELGQLYHSNVNVCCMKEQHVRVHELVEFVSCSHALCWATGRGSMTRAHRVNHHCGKVDEHSAGRGRTHAAKKVVTGRA